MSVEKYYLMNFEEQYFVYVRVGKCLTKLVVLKAFH